LFPIENPAKKAKPAAAVVEETKEGEEEGEEEEIYAHADLYAGYTHAQKQGTSVIDSFQKHLLNRLKAEKDLKREFEVCWAKFTPVI
jgi:hypothetical protein